MTIPNIGSLWCTNVDLPTEMLHHVEPVSDYIMKGDIFTVLETPHTPGTPRYIRVLFGGGTVWLSNSWFNLHTKCLTSLDAGSRDA